MHKSTWLIQDLREMNGESYRAADIPAFLAVQFPSSEQVKMEMEEKNYFKLKKEGKKTCIGSLCICLEWRVYSVWQIPGYACVLSL